MSSETDGKGSGGGAGVEPVDLREAGTELVLEDLDRQVSDLLPGEGEDPAAGPYETAVAAHQLAKQLADLGRVDEAAALYRRSLAIKQRLLGPGDPEVATTLHNLALLFKAAGRPEEAQSLWAEARAVLGT